MLDLPCSSIAGELTLLPCSSWFTLPSGGSRPIQCTVPTVSRAGQNNGVAVARTPGRDYAHDHGSVQQLLLSKERASPRMHEAENITRAALPSAGSGAHTSLTSSPYGPWQLGSLALPAAEPGVLVLLESHPPPPAGALVAFCFSLAWCGTTSGVSAPFWLTVKIFRIVHFAGEASGKGRALRTRAASDRPRRLLSQRPPTKQVTHPVGGRAALRWVSGSH